MQSHENSNSTFFPCENDEHSQSQSQVRARRAIRLDSQVSLSSVEDPGNHADARDFDGPASAGGSQAASAAPFSRGMFAPRDINAMPIDVKQRQQMLLAAAAAGGAERTAPTQSSRSRGGSPVSNASWSRSRHRGNQAHHAPTTAASASGKSSVSHPALGLRMHNQLPKPLSSASRSHNHTREQEEAEALTAITAEETVMVVGGIVVNTRSGPPSATVSSTRLRTHGNSPSPARPADLPRLALSASAATATTASAAPSPTPPPRRAFVLSRAPSVESGSTGSAVVEATEKHGGDDVAAPEAPRESLLLVGGSDVTVSGMLTRPHNRAEARLSASPATEGASLVLGDGPLPPQASTQSKHTPPAAKAAPHRVLHPGQVIEEASEDRAGGLRAVAAMGTERPFALTLAGGDSLTDSSSIMSPLPRPVNPPAKSLSSGVTEPMAPVGFTEDREEETQQQRRTAVTDDDDAAAVKGTTEAEADVRVPQCIDGTKASGDGNDGIPLANAQHDEVEEDGRSKESGTAAESASLMPYSIVSSMANAGGSCGSVAAGSLAMPNGAAAADSDDGGASLLPADSIFIQSSMFLSGAGLSVPAGTASMVLVAGETPTPLRALRGRARDALGDRADAQPAGEATERLLAVEEEEPTEEVKECHRSGRGGDAADSPEPRIQYEEATAEGKPMIQVAGRVRSPLLSTSCTPQRLQRRRSSATPRRRVSQPRVEQGVEASASKSLLGTPSARISDEVKELVERAQEEVRRTRDSLLSTLNAHKANFACAADSAAATTDGEDKAARMEVEGRQPVTEDNAAPTGLPSGGAKQLNFTEGEEDVRADHDAIDFHSATESSGDSFAVRHSRQQLFFSNWSTNQLRSRLCECADSILRRLRGYDRSSRGVLPMDVVIKVAFFVLNTKFGANVGLSSKESNSTVVRHLFTDESLVMLSGAAEATPGADRVAVSGNRATTVATPCQTAAGDASPFSLGAPTPSPHAQARQMHEALLKSTPGVYASVAPSSTIPSPSHMSVTVSSLSGSNRSLNHATTGISGSKRSRETDDAGNDYSGEEEEECRGRPATRMSPTRTLERVMAAQANRTAEEGFLSFYLFLLSAFREVFGERYALKHLGATNASKHDLPLAEECSAADNRRPRHEENGLPRRHQGLNYSTTMADGTVAHRKDNGTSTGADGVRCLSDVEGPLESAFPRLRQRYGARDGAASTMPDATLDPRRTPPLDVLVYYKVFIESLKEL